MNQSYETVPNVISCKDLDYLSDMFNWNYGAYKSSFNAANSVSNQEFNSVLVRVSNVFQGNMTKVLNIINN